ncbi:hypothetical protein DB30_02775 [Enhygromyxa salina]|uniref:TfoX N-terminal domain-containing protein n=1 Tax=Enhygromyxa salina TaxID=215803 RepID=A0A0C2DDM9_9BACT|nr:hypothetical protein DB30_02775 [Enhygromyxa salina]
MYVDFLDELGSGVAPLSAADIRDDLGVAYGGIALVLLVAPLLLSMLVEGPLLLLSDRWRRDRVAALCVGLMGGFMIAAACTSSAWTLALAFGAWGSASGLACGLSQGLLMDAYPEARERWMTRWTLMGAIGDMATPLLILAVASLGLGWRAGLGLAGALHLLHAVVLARVRVQPAGTDECEHDDESERDAPLLERLRAGLRDRDLLMWLGACSLCCLLDEILVAFGVLFMRDELGAPIDTQAIAFAACAVGGVVGLAVTERLLPRIDGLRLLVLASLACAAAFVIWLQMRSIPASVAALFFVGFCVAPLYPICAARAYAARPGQAGLVAAIDQLFAPISLLAPLLIGLVADTIGIVVALGLLLVQPVGVGLVALAGLRRCRAAVVVGPSDPSMAYDEELAQRIRDLLADHPSYSERKMFGGLCFMFAGHMCAGVINDDLMLRVGPERFESTLARKHARPMDFTGRPSKGMVYVGKQGTKTKAQLQGWLTPALEFVDSLPPKQAKPKNKPKLR